MKTSDCEMQTIDKPTIYSLYSFLEPISCGLSAVQKYRSTEVQKYRSTEVQKKKVHRTKPAELLRSLHRDDHLWATMADGVSSEFRLKIASLQNLITFESETAFFRSTATSSRRTSLFERAWRRRERTTLSAPFCPWLHFDHLKYADILALFFILFHPFLSRICYLSLFHWL
jgi:hypothetical protein